MERRAASSRPGGNDDQSSSNRWSSRYSVDNTLLALSGGAIAAASSKTRGARGYPSSSSRFLDRMDRDHQRERSAARNLFGRNNPGNDAGIFGNSFDFRQKFVFGRQGVTVPQNQQQNLRTALSEDDDNGNASSLPPASPRKSWQDQLARRQRQRRYLMIAAAIVLVVLVSVGSVMGKSKRASSSTSALFPPDEPDISQEPMTFYATSDVPNSFQESGAFSDFLKNSLADETSFFAHLGNFQDASATLCQESRYRNVAMLFRDSPVINFVLPGQEDWANCPDPDMAWEFWEGNFLYFENAFGHRPDTNVARQIRRLENFAFVENGVLVLGLHVVEGRMAQDTATPFEETDERNSDNLEWVRYMTADLGRRARAVVVLGNAHPGLPMNKGFFEEMSTFLQVYGKPAAYVHANSGEGDLEEYRPFDGVDNVVVVRVSHGGQNPPVRITVGTGKRPFTVAE